MERKQSKAGHEPPLLRLCNVTKQFGNEVVVHDLSLNVYRGHNLLLQGPSGCGKTTLLRCFALLERIDHGTIIFDGKQVLTAQNSPKPDRSTRLDIGIVFQHLYLWPHLSVLENVALPLKLQGIDPSEADKNATAMIARFSLSHKINQYPNFLSGGQQQRVALARAFVHRPRLLLLDEITTNLDEPNIETVMKSVSTISQEGATIVMVSHRRTVPKDIEFDVLTCKSGYWSPY